jgi:hypothetical protein
MAVYGSFLQSAWQTRNHLVRVGLRFCGNDLLPPAASLVRLGEDAAVSPARSRIAAPGGSQLDHKLGRGDSPSENVFACRK